MVARLAARGVRMYGLEKLRAIDWPAVWREVSDVIDRMPPDRNGMPDRSLDRLLAPRRAPRPAPEASAPVPAPAPPPAGAEGLRHRNKNGSGATPRTSGN